MALWKRGQSTSGPSDPLDTPLLPLSPKDNWTVRDAFEGVQIFGGVGSGKTSGSGAAIARRFLEQDFGGLVLCAKPGERARWQKYAEKAGRLNQFVVISPHNPYPKDRDWRFNFLDYELRRKGVGGGHTENLLGLFSIVLEIIRGEKRQSGGDSGFWNDAVMDLLRNSINLLAIAQGTVAFDDISHLILSAPKSVEQGQDAAWLQSSFCSQMFRKAVAKPNKTEIEVRNLNVAAEYWLDSFAGLDVRPRSSIIATYNSTISVLQSGIAWQLFGTNITIVPEVTYTHGIIIVVDMSIQEYRMVGRIAQGIFKYMFQNAVLRRDVSEHPRPVFLWVDEAQNFISPFDFEYQAVAREARSATVYLTQNISNYYAVLGADSHAQVDALLGNFQTKIFHANSDHKTNEWAADTIEKEWQFILSTGGVTSDSDQGSRNANLNPQLHHKVLPGEFTTLRKGSPTNNFEVDAYLFQGGRVWHETGDTYIGVTFKQEVSK